MDLPFLTARIPAVPAAIKQVASDFYVDELPLYQPCGTGTHTYFRIEKQNLPTIGAVRNLARALNVRQNQIGYAGLKDAKAVTRQWLSVEHVEPARLEALAVPKVRILAISKHGNKLRIGHLAGNRFVIKLRPPALEGLAGDGSGRTPGAAAVGISGYLGVVERVLDVLACRGVPNYFGPQRFGARGDTWQLGRAMLGQDWQACLEVMLGRPGPSDGGDVLRAREMFEAGRFAEAADAWPGNFRDERRACRTLAKSGSHRRAFFGVDKTLKRLYISAYQSRLFNRILAERIDQLDQMMEGDLAWLHAKGAVFRVEDVDREQPRCRAFEISPTGPLFGYRMTTPTGEPGRREQSVLSQEGLKTDDFRAPGAHKVKGGRRPLRFVPSDCSVEAGRDEAGDLLELRFTLPPGCYATAVLREICKTDFS